MKIPTAGDFLVERTIEILIRLLNKEHLSKYELAQEYCVSERTVQRDIMQRLANLPIKKDELGKYYLENNNLFKTYKEELLVLLNCLLGGGDFRC